MQPYSADVVLTMVVTFVVGALLTIAFALPEWRNRALKAFDLPLPADQKSERITSGILLGAGFVLMGASFNWWIAIALSVTALCYLNRDICWK